MRFLTTELSIELLSVQIPLRIPGEEFADSPS